MGGNSGIAGKGGWLMNTDGSMKNQKKTGQEGFTILEALVAIAVFTVAMVGIFSMQTTSVTTNDLARGVTDQSAMAAEVMERLIALPYDDADLTNGSIPPPQKQGRYTISWTVAEDDMIANTKTITATVTWIERGLQKTINLTYVKAKYS
jgi:Tfp pilus assembly protein PilV